MRRKNNTVLVTGYAKAPEGTSLEQIYRYIGVVMVIDIEKDEVIDADFLLLTKTARRFLREIVVGMNLKDINTVATDIRLNYIAPSKEALINSLHRAAQRYWERKDNLVKDM